MALHTHLKNNRKTSQGRDWESHKNFEIEKEFYSRSLMIREGAVDTNIWH